MKTSPHHLLPAADWTAKAKELLLTVSPYTDSFVKRRDLRTKHPVNDFLFVYYSFSPKKLKQWVPSFTESLTITPETHREYPWLNEYWFEKKENILSYNKARIHEGALYIAQFIADLCKNIQQRPRRFGCFGLHEWAMVYKSSPEAIRHQGYPLRLSPEEIAHFVESQTLCCTHYDAYRFFTQEARPLNLFTPSLETRLQMEQGGCVHTNMDLYKWATKLWPWIGSDFIAKTFLLALEARALDMRASPYDLRDDGYEPLKIETKEGREQYQKEQQQLAEQASCLRNDLQLFCHHFLSVNQQRQ